MNKEALKRLIVRLLIDREISGYDVYKELQAKGIKLRSNYLYMILSDMRNRNLLKARWVENRKGPRKHLFSLSEGGLEQFREQVNESLNVMMDAFIHANLNARNAADHVNAIKGSLARFGMPPPGSGVRFVYTSPSFDPLVCYPLGVRILSEMYPTSSIIVVKPSGFKFYDDRPNVTYVDGRRHDIPLKDGFADYLMLEGFPRAVPEAKTIAECARVLSDRGHLLIRIPGVMLEENKPKFGTFAEFALRQYYDIAGLDRIVSIAGVRNLLGSFFGKVMDFDFRGNVIVYAGEKKSGGDAIVLPELQMRKRNSVPVEKRPVLNNLIPPI